MLTIRCIQCKKDIENEFLSYYDCNGNTCLDCCSPEQANFISMKADYKDILLEEAYREANKEVDWDEGF